MDGLAYDVNIDGTPVINSMGAVCLISTLART